MRQAPFFSLPRSVQDRFIESIRGVGVPSPILASAKSYRTHLAWWVGSLAILVAWYFFLRLGYGKLDSSLALTGPAMIVVHAAFAMGLVTTILIAQGKAFRIKRSPFATGNYLFPCGVMAVGLDKIQSYYWADIHDVKANGASVVVATNGGSFTFKAGTTDRAQAVLQTLETARQKYREAEAHGDIRELAVLDPLKDSGLPNPLAPTEPHHPPSAIGRVAFVAIILVSVPLVGGTVWWLRNQRSESALYRAAVEQNTTQAYKHYLERGGTREEVSTQLLPRAELKDAEAVGTVKAIEAYIAAHPDSAIGAEVTAAHKKALLSALERAKKRGTLTALREFEKAHAGHELVAPELLLAKDAVYAKVLSDLEKVAGSGADVMPFAASLLKFVRANGSTVQLRFRRKFPQSHDRIDDVVKKSPYFYGPVLLPGQYYKGKHLDVRENKAAEALLGRLQKAFPKDIVVFKRGPEVDDREGELPPIKAPTLFLEHSATLSGGFVGIKRRGMYMGVTQAFRATFRVPKQDDKQLVFRLRLWRAPKLEMIDDLTRTPADLYGELAGDAFDTFVREYLAYWFKS